MPLAANSKLGPYEIKSTLGVGGMGEVYRARDSRLNRDVAIKVLREDGSSPDLRSRFEREARAVAALNHPNIIAVYDFGIENGQQYIVSELLEGESLRALIKGKPLPARRLIEIAAQVADGLAAAHSAGIVHRDLKPENIMLGKDGRAKILDFGLARHTTSASAAVPPGSDETFVPNTQNLTSAGAVLGTAAYMSPEQALGQETDYRSDQFSFGLILYEMVTGKQAFAKPSSVETMAAIVREDPPPIEEKLPPPLKWIIDRCLAKEPDRRYESTRDLYRDLVNLRDHFSDAYSSSGVITPVTPKGNPRKWKFLTAIAAACLAGALIAYLLKPTGEFIQNYKYSPMAIDVATYAWSPDGKGIAYSAYVNGTYQVFLRYLNSPVPHQLTHGENGAQVQGWSSDRNHIVVIEHVGEEKKLNSVPIVGGDPEFIMGTHCIYACDLSRDGKVWAEFINDKDGYYRIAVSDPLGSPMRTYAPAPFASKDLIGRPSLAFSADGNKIIFSRSADKGSEAWLLPYPAGSGSPRRVFTHWPDSYSEPSFSWMPDNRRVIFELYTSRDSPIHLWMADTESRDMTQLTTGTSNESRPLVSPDGKSVLYVEANNQVDINSISLEGGSAKTLISTGHDEFGAAWSSNSAKMAWVTDRNGAPEIWVRTADGSDRPIVTGADFPPDSTGYLMNPSLSPDGERVIFGRGEKVGWRLWIASLSGGTPVRLTNDESGNEFGGCWSPYGSRFVYHHFQNGTTTLMVAKTGGGTAPAVLKENILTNLPNWSPTDEWITYRDEKGWNLISSDGKRSKSLGNLETDGLTFGRDGKLLYGILSGKNNASKDSVFLFSLDPTTLKQKMIKDIGNDLRPSFYMWPSVRFSLAPDGKSFIYSTGKSRNDLWMLTGYRQLGLWNQLRSVFAK